MELKTPLYEAHVRAGGKMVPFAGYLLPVQYQTGVIKEHMAVRQAAGLFDVSHMGEILCEGPDALANLQRLLTNSFVNLTDGQARYSPMCNERGGTVDDLIVYKRSEDHYLILLAHERYDVPFKAKDGAQLDDSSEVFSYVLCAICPVKPGKAALRYIADEKEFHNQGGAYTVGAPELGFLFPAFDGRRTNLYNCLYYSRSLENNHPELVQALFKLDPPEPANVQKESFGELLSQSLEDACSLPLVQKVHEQLRQNIEAHKELKSDEPLVVSRQEVSEVLSGCGVEESKLAKFNVEFDQHFGADAALSPANLIDAKKFQLKTPDVTIQVNPERTDLVQTRVIGGVKYLLICADDGVEVNGIQVDLDE